MDHDLPEDLRRLLPPGRTVRAGDDGDGAGADGDGEPAIWLSDDPVPAGLWTRVRNAHDGFWPLLLGAEDDEGAPWTTGEAFSGGKTAPADHDPEALLRDWWGEHLDDDETELVAPFGTTWPGRLATTPAHHADPHATAAAVADLLLAAHPTMRLGLVAAGTGAEALAAAGWDGAVNYVADTGTVAAVVADWERRYGARVVALDGFATLHLSVSAPPRDHEAALRVAAEHFAFCPDNIWQGVTGETLSTYASTLVGAEHWVFWWD